MKQTTLAHELICDITTLLMQASARELLHVVPFLQLWYIAAAGFKPVPKAEALTTELSRRLGRYGLHITGMAIFIPPVRSI